MCLHCVQQLSFLWIAPQAADPQYDNLYRRLPRFEYDECSGTYNPETELTWTDAKDEF